MNVCLMFVACLHSLIHGLLETLVSKDRRTVNYEL